MKKTFLWPLLTALLASCGTGGTSTPAAGTSQPEGSTPAQSSTNQGPKKELIYRSWDLGTEEQNNEERQLVKAFEEAENVTVHIVELTKDDIKGAFYWDGIKTSMVNGIDKADVMMIPNLDWPLAYGFLLNVKEFTDADEEFAKVHSSLRDACTLKNGVYALPARMNLMGYYVNKTLVEGTLGVSTRNLGCASEFSAIENIINKSATHRDVFGINDTAHFIDTMANVLDETGEFGYFTWDGSSYHLDSDAFIEGVQKARSIYEAGKTLAHLKTAEEKTEFGLDPEQDQTVDAWNKAKLALRWGYTYEAPDIVENNTLGQSYKFIGNPGGKIPMVGDFYGICKTTKEPELSYKFAKWMGFGKQGFLKRMELYEPKGVCNSLPFLDDDDLVNRYFEMFGVGSSLSGLEEAYEYAKENAMVEGVKVVPGYLAARQTKKTGVAIQSPDKNIDNATTFELLDACVKDGYDIANYAEQLNALANKTYTDWMNNYGGDYD